VVGRLEENNRDANWIVSVSQGVQIQEAIVEFPLILNIETRLDSWYHALTAFPH
jgi:hypothetical protein